MDQPQLWLSITAFLMFSLGSGVIAGYIAGRLDELGRYAVSMAVLGLGTFFMLLLSYTFYLRFFALMPADWTGALLWGHYPLMISAVLFGWHIAGMRRATLAEQNPPRRLRSTPTH